MARRAANLRIGAWLFVGPASLYLLVFAVLPLAAAFWMSLHHWPLLRHEHEFIGLKNYARLLSEPFFRQALWNTLLYVALSVPMSVTTSLLVAALVARPLRGVALFRALFYLPSISSQVALSMVWIWILLPEVGLLNGAARAVGLSEVDYLNTPGWALFSLAMMSVWVGLGPRMVIFLAGLQSIPGTVYEAAAIDGCSAWRRFWSVTLPLLAPTTLFVVITTTIAAFQVITPVYVMTKGGPRRTTDVLLYHIYQEAWQRFEAGSAAAMTYVLFAMMLIVGACQYRLLAHRDAHD